MKLVTARSAATIGRRSLSPRASISGAYRSRRRAGLQREINRSKDANMKTSARFHHALWVLLGLAALNTSSVADEPGYTRQEDVIYGRKYGVALTLDVFRPKQNAN